MIIKKRKKTEEIDIQNHDTRWKLQKHEKNEENKYEIFKNLHVN